MKKITQKRRQSILKVIEKLMLENEVFDYNFISFQHLNILDVKSKERIPRDSKSVIACIFPYFSKKALNGNISAYCAVPDYHTVIRMKLKSISEKLKEIYPNEEFEVFVDSSPIEEIDMALKAGLGVLGKNSLLINEKYGSFIFIGEIVTTLEIKAKLKNIKNCIGCDLCIKNCPGKAINETGVNTDLCAGFLNQKKGDLQKEEIEIIKDSNSLWGCDICQLVCPYNKDLNEVSNEFSNDIINTINKETVQAIYKKRAFGFKGLKILLRNLDLFDCKENENEE